MSLPRRDVKIKQAYTREKLNSTLRNQPPNREDRRGTPHRALQGTLESRNRIRKRMSGLHLLFFNKYFSRSLSVVCNLEHRGNEVEVEQVIKECKDKKKHLRLLNHNHIHTRRCEGMICPVLDKRILPCIFKNLTPLIFAKISKLNPLGSP